MAHSSIALDTNMRLSYSRPGELSTYTNAYMFQSDGLNGSPINESGVYAFWQKPKMARQGVSQTWGEFILTNLTIQRMPGTGLYRWLVTETWTTRHGETCMAKVTRTAGVRNVQMFRRGATMPSNMLTGGAFPPTSAELISTGTKVDMRGTPLNYAIPQSTIVIETMYEARKLKADTTDPWPAYEAIASNYRLNRNSVSFMGLNPGCVLFLGMDENEVDDLWRICAYRFVTDAWAHLEQRVYPEVNGKPLVADTSTWPTGDPMMNASKVYWYQPYPNTADFYNMFTQCVKDELITPSPALIAT